MDRVAIVYYQRDAPAKLRATELAGKLHSRDMGGELFKVTSSSAHELIYFDAMVLVGPMRFSRMHGLALARAVFGYRPVALLLTGSGNTERNLRLLPRHMRGEVPVFAVANGPGEHPAIDSLVTWLRAMIGHSGYRAVS